MGRRRQILEATKVAFIMPQRDWDELKSLYPSIGAAGAIRSLVHQHLESLRKKRAGVTETLVTEIGDLDVE